jgi:hypothetical protein
MDLDGERDLPVSNSKASISIVPIRNHWKYSKKFEYGYNDNYGYNDYDYV